MLYVSKYGVSVVCHRIANMPAPAPPAVRQLRIRDHIPGPETKFRDGAHGFMAWVVGVVLMIAVLLATAALSAHTGASPTSAISDEARKAAAYLSFWSFLALLFGAIAATLAGILGGELRDTNFGRLRIHPRERVRFGPRSKELN